MKPLYPLTILLIGIISTACSCTCYYASPIQQAASLQNCQKRMVPKNPLCVAVYTKDHYPKKPYTIVGKEVVSKFNAGGIKRQEGILKDILRNQAANLGGDGVIIVHHDDKSITGEVISYQDATHDAGTAV